MARACTCLGVVDEALPLPHIGRELARARIAQALNDGLQAGRQ